MPSESSTSASPEPHVDDPACWCAPIVEYTDDEGRPLVEPLIIHNESAGIGILKEASRIIVP
jgi:hypothetical protein